MGQWRINEVFTGITLAFLEGAKIGVIGLGYVGLPLALVFAEAGLKAIGLDVDTKKIDALNRGETYIKHIGAERVDAAMPSSSSIRTTLSPSMYLIEIEARLGRLGPGGVLTTYSSI